MMAPHYDYVTAAYCIFVLALLWDFFTPYINYRKTLRAIILLSRRNPK